MDIYDKTQQELKLREYYHAIQPFIQKMANLRIVYSSHRWLLDEDGSLKTFEILWTDNHAQDLYKYYEDCIALIKQRIFGGL